MTVDARRRITALGGLGLALAGVALWMLPLGPTGGASPGRAAAAPSEAEAVPPDARGREIGRLQDHLRQNPEDARSWAALGFALVEQARVTADPSSYPKAEGAFDRSLELQPEGNFTALSGRGALANARHDFAAGLSWGEKARATNPDNAEVHGVIGDALLELGRYPEAFAAFQRMVDLRPGLAAYARVSYARELRGDVEGAREALEAALEAAATPADAAFAQHFLGELAWNGGDVDEARRRYELAARLDAGFVPPRAGLARLRAALGETDRAVEEWRAVVARSPLPEYVAELGNLYLVIGRTAEAEEQFALLEAQQRLLRAGGVNVDLEIALFNADHGVRLAEGLARPGRSTGGRLPSGCARATSPSRPGRRGCPLCASAASFGRGPVGARVSASSASRIPTSPTGWDGGRPRRQATEWTSWPATCRSAASAGASPGTRMTSSSRRSTSAGPRCGCAPAGRVRPGTPAAAWAPPRRLWPGSLTG